MKLPEGIDQAFAVAAAELGMACASRLYVDTVRREGDEAVGALRDALGRQFPVLDAVAAHWLAQRAHAPIDPAPVVAACRGLTQLVVVGLEAFFLDALLPRLEGVRVALLRESPLQVDWERVLANFEGRVEPVDLARFQARAGPRSALLTFAYGAQSASAHVLPAWVRVSGEDVRTQFRSLVAWDVLRAPMFVYPRWLVEVERASFTEVV